VRLLLVLDARRERRRKVGAVAAAAHERSSKAKL
jgi:hypothetical protein